ncbi:MAG: hypothetical protein ABI342_07435 [Nitrososphaera sp.]|jgi:hypothetical protein
MLFFNRKTTEEERKEEKEGTDWHFSRYNQAKNRSSDADLRCEEAIMEDKERFGRVRTSLMKHLREEFGRDVADRALRRINKRRTEGYFKK